MLVLAGMVGPCIAADPGAAQRVTPVAGPESHPAPEIPRPQPYWKKLDRVQGFLGLSYQAQTGDGELRGLRLSSGWVEELPYKPGVLERYEFDAWLSRASAEDQVIWAAGLGAELPYALAVGPVRAFPRGLLGVEYRTDEPQAGLGAFFGVALGVEVWLGRHVAISFTIERRWSYPGNDLTQLGIETRFAGESIPSLTFGD